MAEDWIRRVADELEIRTVVTRAAALADEGDLDEYASLFTEDAVWRLAPAAGQAEAAPTVGRANIKAAGAGRRASGGSGPGSHSRHLVVVNSVTLAGDTAKAQSYMSFIRNADTAPQVATFKVYEDEFVRTTDGWKMSSRSILPG
jgi:ketosteroid isomerase-like protein